MSTWRLLLTVYVVGGLTFVPLLLVLILAIAYYTFLEIPKPPQPTPRADDPANLVRGDDESEKLVLKTSTDDLAEKFHRKHDADVAAGYFAVCREYVPGGVNGKPPDKLSPAGEVVASESPSVYQSMYRSIFDRSQKPTIEPYKDGLTSDGGVKKVKKANNVFYIVLRHGHLMLYNDIQQLEVRYVISLEYHDVDVFSGNEKEKIPESELWIKRNAIRLQRRHTPADARPTSLPFFLFSENLSEKEDFFFALLKNQENSVRDAPLVQEFDVKDIITLVQKLHSSEEQLETRWLNAFVGRLFLALYKTPFMEDVIRKKLTKKLSRVKKPNFITKLALQKIDPGFGSPFITNPRLKDLSVDGDCVAEMDVNYAGNFRIEVAATARIDLGSRFKAREVDMVLAATCKKLSGRLLLRLKPPPSNRLWFSFEKMPKMDMALEPIVSSRQITYGIILKAIESRIMEVIAETLVQPFWDDIPFLDTAGERFRGGIWKKEPVSVKSTEIRDEDADDEAEAGKEPERDIVENLKRDDRTMSMPVLSEMRNTAASHAARSSASSLKEALGAYTADKSPKASTPRVMRSPSFATAADPTLSPTHVGGATPGLDIKDSQKRDSMLLDLSRSLSTSPNESNAGSAPVESILDQAMRERNPSYISKPSIEGGERQPSERRSSAELQNTIGSSSVQALNSSISGASTASSRASSVHDGHRKGLTEAAKSLTHADRKQTMNSINAAATAAQKWGWGVLARARQREAEAAALRDPVSATARLPMGRGQPLPPPGQPLPGPDKPGLFSIPKRTPVISGRPPTSEPSAPEPKSDNGSPRPVLPERPDRRRRQASLQNNRNGREDEILVVEAPIDSIPTTPIGEHHDEFFGHGEEPEDEEQSVRSGDVPPLPVRPDSLEKASLDTATGGSLQKAVHEREVNGIDTE